MESMHAGEHSIRERLAGDIVERGQDEKVNRRNCLVSDKALQDRHHSGAIKAALARKPKRRLDVVERRPSYPSSIDRPRFGGRIRACQIRPTNHQGFQTRPASGETEIGWTNSS